MVEIIQTRNQNVYVGPLSLALSLPDEVGQVHGWGKQCNL